LLDARVELLADAPRALVHNAQVDFYSGSQEMSARIRLLEGESIEPGQSAWVQLRLSRPAVVARRDRFILRVPSPSATIGGGEVIDAHPRYHKRFQAALIESLEELERGAPDELVLAALDRRRELRASNRGETASNRVAGPRIEGGKVARGLVGYELAEIARQSNLSQDVTLGTLETLIKERRVRKVGGWWFANSIWDALCNETIALLSEQHRLYPLRGGLPKEEWRTRLGLTPRMATDIFHALQEEGVLADALSGNKASGAPGGLIRLPDFQPAFTEQQQRQIERLFQVFRTHPFATPGRAELEAEVGGEVLSALLEQGTLIRLGSAADPVFFLRETYDEAVEKVVNYLRAQKTITAAEARDLLGTTRKYVLPLLEHLDERRITRRLGDQRVLGIIP
jgi:selenocysteine-specific elongation factor